ncbi:MAG: STAS domain-containing protein [Bacteroidota bacterium]
MREFIKIKENKKGKHKKLSVEISQYLTIEDVSELKNSILERINSCNSVAVNMKKMENIDVSGLQLLFATERKAHELGIEYSLTLEANDELKSLLSHSGFGKLLTEIQNINQVN